MQNELSTQNKLRTPLENALEMDENGWVSVKKLYEFLGYSPQNYSRWVERNLSKNAVFEEYTDFKPLNTLVLPTEERTDTRVQPHPTQDYLISGELAKRFALLAHNERGAEVRDYYTHIENNTLAKLAQLKEYIDNGFRIQNQLLESFKGQLALFETNQENMAKQIFEVNETAKKSLETAQKSLGLISTFESGILVPDGQDSPWATEMGEKLHTLAEYMDISYDELVNKLIAELKPRCGFNFYEYVGDYHRSHKGDRIWKLNVISRYDDLREAFEYLYNELAERYMPY